MGAWMRKGGAMTHETFRLEREIRELRARLYAIHGGGLALICWPAYLAANLRAAAIEEMRVRAAVERVRDTWSMP